MRTYFLPVLLLAAVAGLARSQPAVGVRPPPGVPTKEPPIAGVRPVSYSEGPSPIQIAPVVPPAFLLLADRAVQQEIALKGDQKTAADRVRLGWSVPARGLDLGRFGKISADSLRAAANGRTADFLAKGLTKEQRTRLDQILFQLREKEFGSHQALVMAARDLGLRSDQMEDVRSLKALRVEEIDKSVTSGKRFEKVKLEVQATNGDTFDRMAEMLTRAQRERLKALRGKQFDTAPGFQLPQVDALPMQPDARRPRAVPPEVSPPRGHRVVIERYPSELFGVYDVELRYLDAATVRAELKVTTEQGRKLELALREWSEAHLALPGLDLNRAGRLHERTAKAIEDILSAEQRKRFGEIMMQRRSLVSPEAMCGHPAAVEGLKLTPNQLQQLRDGKLVDDVLTAAQLTARKALMGRPIELPTGLIDPLLGMVPPPVAPIPVRVQQAPVAIARDYLVLTERLGLSAEQIKKLRELAEDEPRIRDLIHKELSLEDTPPVAGSGRGLTSERAVTERYRAAVEQQCWDTLDPAQQSIARKLYGRGR